MDHRASVFSLPPFGAVLPSDGPVPPLMDDAPKNLRNDRYTVIRALGEGGQGSTFEAVDKLHGKPVAIKRFRVRGAKSWKEVELAEREAKVLSSLSHPNLPRYVEHFEEGGELFLVTDKIEGESLAELRQRRRALDEAEVRRFLRDAGKALDYLHGRAPPVIHRDIKPSNVIRRPDGSFVLIDFGSVRDRMKPAGGSTVVGTFGYMAPEQFQGRAMPGSDVYAVGTTALTLLTGVEPEDLPHRGLAIDVDAALRGHQASPALRRALASMLEPDPDRRAPRIVPLLDAPEPRPLERDVVVRGQGNRQGRREARREERERHRQNKRDRKAAEHERRRIERGRERPWIPWLIVLLLIIGLTFAQVAVMLALRVVVPAVILVLSMIFGKGMRPAASGVAEAGKRAEEALARARDVLRGRSIEANPSQIRVEIKDEAPTEAAEETERQAEAELAAEEEAAQRVRKRTL